MNNLALCCANCCCNSDICQNALLGYKLKSWYFRLEFVFRVRDQSLKVEDDLRALCLRDLLESTLEMNNLV
jgi:hypothetical protein